MDSVEAPSSKIVGIPLHLPSHRRAPCPRIVVYILVLMLTISKSRRTPHAYTVPVMLLLTRELCEDGTHA